MQKKTSKLRKCPRCHGTGTLQANKYGVGRSFEYVVRDFLRDRGWKVTRSYKSAGIYDLMAQKDGITLGIQAKKLSGKNKAYLKPKDRQQLNSQVGILRDQPYIMYTWTSRKTPPREVKFDYPIRIIHAYKDGMHIQWRELVGIDEWVECKALILKTQ